MWNQATLIGLNFEVPNVSGMLLFKQLIFLTGEPNGGGRGNCSLYFVPLHEGEI